MNKSYHKIAVDLRKALAYKLPTTRKINFTEPKRKRKQKRKGKSGRKRPRVNDIMPAMRKKMRVRKRCRKTHGIIDI